jgi:hypothetical protein
VLGAVVLKDALQVAQPRDEPQVREEDRDADELLDDDEHDAAALADPGQARQRRGQEEEQADRQRQRGDDRADPRAARHLLALVAHRGVGRDAHRLQADAERLEQRDRAADHGQAQQPVAAQHRLERERLDVDRLVGQPHGDGPRRHAAHHHALEHRLAAHGGVRPRDERAVGQAFGIPRAHARVIGGRTGGLERPPAAGRSVVDGA